MKKLIPLGFLFFVCLALLSIAKPAHADTVIAPTSITTNTVWSSV